MEEVINFVDVYKPILKTKGPAMIMKIPEKD
jgi:hypothetical protein